jgi:hypothetical protein
MWQKKFLTTLNANNMRQELFNCKKDLMYTRIQVTTQQDNSKLIEKRKILRKKIQLIMTEIHKMFIKKEKVK